MFYEFPTSVTLDEVRAIVKEHNENLGVTAFIEADRGDHVIFNYLLSFDGSFPQPDTRNPATDRKYAVLRELRGLIMCPVSGKVIARRFHKFFNVNEKSFTQAHLVDWSRPHVVLEKLDGSMITCLMSGGALRWGTKMGLTDVAMQAEQFTLIRPQYATFVTAMMDKGLTPIFEWTSRQQRIVIDYPEDDLILTAIRDNHTGAYYRHGALRRLGAQYGITVVKALAEGVGDIRAFLETVRHLKDAEGYVIVFNNGHMLKVKAEEYCRIHSTQDVLRFEKDVWSLIVNEKMDDVLPFMIERDRSRVRNFIAEFDTRIALKAMDFYQIVNKLSADIHGLKKDFAIRVNSDKDLVPIRGMLFSIYDGKSAADVIRAHIAKNVSTGPKLDGVRWLLGDLYWKDFYAGVVEDDDPAQKE